VRLGASTFLLAAAIAACVALPSSASTIQLGINGDAQVGSNYIDFGNYPTGTVYTPAPGYGTFVVSLVNSGIFSSAGVTTGETGNIQSLGGSGTGPTGAITLPSAFMTFNGGGSGLSLWATNIPAGDVGPFTLTDTADGAVASFDVDGYIWQNGAKVDTFTGTFSATFDGQTVASLFTNLPIDTPFSATFTATAIPTTIPEPASMLLMGAGLLGVGLVSRRRARKS
jgi:hypothetical protein